MRVLFGKLYNRFLKALYLLTYGDLRIMVLRKLGVKIGERCQIFSADFGTEPYLVSLGDHVTISNGTRFLTHDGGAWIFRDKIPDLDIFGTIKLGNNVVVGFNCILMPGTIIGSNCIIGAGCIVRGNIPDNSIVMGNPAKVIMKTSLLETMYKNHPNRLNIKNLKKKEKEKIIKSHFSL